MQGGFFICRYPAAISFQRIVISAELQDFLFFNIFHNIFACAKWEISAENITII